MTIQAAEERGWEDMNSGSSPGDRTGSGETGQKWLRASTDFCMGEGEHRGRGGLRQVSKGLLNYHGADFVYQKSK